MKLAIALIVALVCATARGQEWTVKDSTVDAPLAEAVTVKVPLSETKQFRFLVHYPTILPQGEILYVAGVRTKSSSQFLRVISDRVVDRDTIEFTAEVAGFNVSHEITANIRATRDRQEVHFGTLPLVVQAVLPDAEQLPEHTVIVGLDSTADVVHVPPGNVKLGVVFARLYYQAPAVGLHVGRASAETLDEAIEPWDRRFPDTATVESVTELADKTGMIVEIADLHEHANYRLGVRYVDQNGRIQMVTLTLSTKKALR